jgi:beta-phosphoglucomutase-like phosphatase (HAD superfamily)
MEKSKGGRPKIGDKPRTPRQRMADTRNRRRMAMTEAIGREADATDTALADLLAWALRQDDPAPSIRRVLAELNKRYPPDDFSNVTKP